MGAWAFAGDRIADGDLMRVVAAFGLGEVRRVAFIAEGMMNRNWRVETRQGVFALKQIVDVPVPRARQSLSVLGALAADGLPVCAPRLTGTAETVADIDGHSYCLFPWAAGWHRPGITLELGEAADLGALLGKIHRGLAAPETALSPVAEAPRAKVTTAASAAAEAERFLNVIASRDAPDQFDRAAARALEDRQALLAKYAGQCPVGEVPQGPVGWTHGDFQPLNILWSGSAVTAVLDWDRLGVRPYGEEVTRTAQVQFGIEDGGLDLERVAAFTAGYRSEVPLCDGDLVDAVERLWWKRMTDFWQLQWHYDRDDHGPDALWVSGERLLTWWTDRRAEVLAAFTTRP
jgi:Ser/Thr protein kinase RdoA (MazF antagonist)